MDNMFRFILLQSLHQINTLYLFNFNLFLPSETLIKNTSHDFEDFFTDPIHCSWLGNANDLDFFLFDICAKPEYFEKIITAMGTCFTFNSFQNHPSEKANFKQTMHGASNALVLSLNTRQHNNSGRYRI